MADTRAVWNGRTHERARLAISLAPEAAMIAVVLLVTVFSPILFLAWRRPTPARIAYPNVKRSRSGHAR